jgi:hypothetical protein
LNTTRAKISQQLEITLPDVNGFDGSFAPIDLNSDDPIRARRRELCGVGSLAPAEPRFCHGGDKQGKPGGCFGYILRRRLFEFNQRREPLIPQPSNATPSSNVFVRAHGVGS